MVVDPDWCFGVVAEGMVVQPLRERRRTAHDQRCALSGFAGEGESESDIRFRDVLELEISDLGDACASLPEDGDECLVADVLTGADDLLALCRGGEFGALLAFRVTRTDVG